MLKEAASFGTERNCMDVIGGEILRQIFLLLDQDG